MSHPSARRCLRLVPAWWLTLLTVGCGAEVALFVNQGQLTLRLSVNTDELVLVIGGEPQTLEVSLVRTEETGPVNLSVADLPEGVSIEIRQPGILNEGSITFQATADAAPQQDVRVVVTASDGASVDTAEVFLDIVPP